MNKFLGIFLFLGVLFLLSGAVSADPTLDTYYIDDEGQDITTAQVGDDVEYLAEVQNDANPVLDANLEVKVSSDVGMENIVYYTSMDGGATWVTNPPTVTKVGDTITWAIGPLAANQLAILNIHGTVTQAGTEISNATLNYTTRQEQDVSVNSVATLTVTEPEPEPVPVAAAGVPMQETGVPIGLAELAAILIGAGMIYARKQ